MNNKLLISAVMSVYNGEKYVAEAIESILNQTYTNFEFIIVNDGSKDKSLEIIQEYMKKDKRIVLIDRENKGLPYSLNEGVSIAKGEYIARMDADDISLPSRFEKQLKYMQENNLDICGTFMQKFSDTSKVKQIQIHPINDKDIKFTLSYYSCLAHPTVMLKKEVFKKVQYNPEYKQAQDYQLWVDCVKQNFVLGNVPNFLLEYRQHDAQAGVAKAKNQTDTAHEIMRNYAEYLGNKEKNLIEEVISLKYTASYKQISHIYKEMLELSNKKDISKETIFDIAKFLYNSSSPKTPLIYFAYRKATKGMKKDNKEELQLFLKSLVIVKRESKLYQGLKKIRDMVKK